MEIDKLGKEIVEPTLDLSLDYSEIFLDEFLGEGLLKEVPVIRTIAAAVKSGLAVREKFFVKKFLVFLREFHLGKESKDELDKLKTTFDSDKKFREKVTEYLVLTIEQIDSTSKAKIVAHLFRAHLDKKFDWDRFVALNTSLRNLDESTFPMLQAFAKNNFANMNAAPTIKNLRDALNPETGDMDFFAMHKEYQGLLWLLGLRSCRVLTSE